MAVLGIRGATTARHNSNAEILSATMELLKRIMAENRLAVDDIISIIFTMTPDLNAGFPAAAAREIGLSDVPLLGAQEIAKPDGLRKCIRVLMHVNTRMNKTEIRHIYLREAVALRPDLARKGE
ncbi:MAG: chorismate mutase [Bacillota bacterium]